MLGALRNIWGVLLGKVTIGDADPLRCVVAEPRHGKAMQKDSVATTRPAGKALDLDLNDPKVAETIENLYLGLRGGGSLAEDFVQKLRVEPEVANYLLAGLGDRDLDMDPQGTKRLIDTLLSAHSGRMADVPIDFVNGLITSGTFPKVIEWIPAGSIQALPPGFGLIQDPGRLKPVRADEQTLFQPPPKPVPAKPVRMPDKLSETRFANKKGDPRI